MPSTFFSEPPHWRWLIVFYFFIGGIAGGCYFLAALIDLFGRASDRPLTRLGYRIAFPAVSVCGIVLVVDLSRPERFWHMLLQSETWRPMFKSYSPMSFGSWGLLIFGFFAFVSFLATLRSEVNRDGIAEVRPPGVVGVIVAVLGGLSGLFVASYTGVLLAVTNRPIWADTTLLGLVFVISSASTSIALLLLLGSRSVFSIPELRALQRFDVAVLVLELIALIALVASLGSLVRVWLNEWGVLLAIGVVGIGIIAPLVLQLRAQTPVTGRARAAAVLVLIGGFLLRVVIVLSSESI
jgi:formate-dependent nitrite reductase membrane component NrfD